MGHFTTGTNERGTARGHVPCMQWAGTRNTERKLVKAIYCAYITVEIRPMDYTECIHAGKKKEPIHNKDTVMRRACWESRIHSKWRNGCGVNELSIGLNHQNAKTDVLACKGST